MMISNTTRPNKPRYISLHKASEPMQSYARCERQLLNNARYHRAIVHTGTGRLRGGSLRFLVQLQWSAVLFYTVST